MAEAKPKKKAAPRKKKKQVEPGSAGLSAKEVGSKEPPAEIRALIDEMESDGARILSAYREPLGGRWVVFAALPLEQVKPTPYQRNLSDAHVKRLTDVIGRTGRYLDPVIAVRMGPKDYQSPNGHHRLGAMRNLGSKSITALVVADPEVAHLILALNVEKAHNLREKSTEVIRLARGLSALDDRNESEFTLEFEEAAFLTLGICYEKNGRFAGGAYHPILKRVDDFLQEPLAKSLEIREGRAAAVMEIDAIVVEHTEALKEKGMDSPYLRKFVVARINPIRFRRGVTLSFDDAIEKMRAAAEKFNPDKISPRDLSGAGGASED
ncbi:MAG: ParB N-terminal domain-containing protein [Planctomycetota bacterium]|nr:ParB N-terminal domain-containing protein [Planctomycetota bacterium]